MVIRHDLISVFAVSLTEEITDALILCGKFHGENMRVALMEDYLDHAKNLECVARLEKRVDLTIHTTKAAGPKELLERLRGVQAVITIRDRVMFTAELLGQLPDLKLISVCGPRLTPHIDLEAAKAAGIEVLAPVADNTPAVIHKATAEMAWALILGLAKRSLENHRAVQDGRWQTHVGTGLAGKTLGIIGLGKIGGAVAAIGNAMGMSVLAWSPWLTQERAASLGAQAASFDELLGQSDVVTIHANATRESADLFGPSEFRRMKRRALLINTSRAALVAEQALKDALDNEEIAGAGLDVYWQEPLPATHWLRQHSRVLLQPHMGGFTEEGYEWLIQPAVDNLLAYLDRARQRDGITQGKS